MKFIHHQTLHLHHPQASSARASDCLGVSHPVDQTRKLFGLIHHIIYQVGSGFQVYLVLEVGGGNYARAPLEGGLCD
jgi:hypothetical protein